MERRGRRCYITAEAHRAGRAPDSRLALEPVSRSQRGESEADRSLASADCRRIYKGSVNSGDNLQAARVCTLGCAGKTPRRAKTLAGLPLKL